MFGQTRTVGTAHRAKPGMRARLANRAIIARRPSTRGSESEADGELFQVRNKHPIIQRSRCAGGCSPLPCPYIQTEVGKEIKDVRKHVKDDDIDGVRVFQRFDVDNNGSGWVYLIMFLTSFDSCKVCGSRGSIGTGQGCKRGRGHPCDNARLADHQPKPNRAASWTRRRLARLSYFSVRFSTCRGQARPD